MQKLKMERNLFLYWDGNDYKLINILRKIIYLQSTKGKGYTVKLITEENIKEYIKEIPEHYWSLKSEEKADFVKVNVICDYGGIWLNGDILVMDSLDSLFNIMENKDGFFIKDKSEKIWTGLFGSKPNTEIMKRWKNKIDWLGEILQGNYEVFEGKNNMIPVNWELSEDEFIDKPYDNYKNLLREYQPVIVAKVYNKVENMTEEEILEGNMPLNYFLKKSYENMELVDYDFIEIGTSNFDTLIQNADNNTKGISVDAVKYYIDNLPNKLNVKKLNVGISNVNSYLDVYYIPEEIIKIKKLPAWFKGCNCINTYHPLHIQYNITNLCTIEKVKVITSYELFYQNKVRKVKYLKIDTEGHDCIILKCLFSYIKYLPKEFHPDKILFETNIHSMSQDVDEVINLFSSIGYKLQSRGYDTIIIKN